ncbi:hypothetical protein HYI36_18125 [Bacillus sp. Gen3]|nr:hypothetical protein [Bacillus sp. Gen3]
MYYFNYKRIKTNGSRSIAWSPIS